MRFLALPIFSVRCLVTAGLFLVLGARALGQLASQSPFLPSSGSAPTVTAQNAPLEFRAILDTGDGVLYRIHDPAKKAGAWVKANERDANFGVVVKQYD